MKITTQTSLGICLLLVGLFALSACGQKGPIEVDRPILTQEEVLEEAV